MACLKSKSRSLSLSLSFSEILFDLLTIAFGIEELVAKSSGILDRRGDFELILEMSLDNPRWCVA